MQVRGPGGPGQGPDTHTHTPRETLEQDPGGLCASQRGWGRGAPAAPAEGGACLAPQADREVIVGAVSLSLSAPSILRVALAPGGLWTSPDPEDESSGPPGEASGLPRGRPCTRNPGHSFPTPVPDQPLSSSSLSWGRARGRGPWASIPRPGSP